MKCGQNYTLHILIALKEALSKGLVFSRLIDLKFLPAQVGNDHAQIVMFERACFKEQ